MHEDFRDLATELISENGAIAQLVNIENSGTAWNPEQSESITDIIALNVKIKFNEIDGDLVKSSDLMFLIDSSVEPKLSDKFRYKNNDYEIKNIDSLEPADTVIRYKIQVRL